MILSSRRVMPLFHYRVGFVFDVLLEDLILHPSLFVSQAAALAYDRQVDVFATH
jgi:hypothetical protein